MAPNLFSLSLIFSGVAMREAGHTALSDYILNIDRWFDCMNAGELLTKSC